MKIKIKRLIFFPILFLCVETLSILHFIKWFYQSKQQRIKLIAKLYMINALTSWKDNKIIYKSFLEGKEANEVEINGLS